MTIGGIAWLIVAISIAVFVVFLCLILFNFAGVVKELRETVSKINETLSVVNRDADRILVEVEGIANKANHLVDDLNGKLGKTDPLFKAIGDVGASVSDLNESSKNIASNIISGTRKPKQSPVEKLVRKSVKVGASKLASKSTNTTLSESDLETHSLDETVKIKVTETPSKLEQLSTVTPSKTAGEITLKERG